MKDGVKRRMKETRQGKRRKEKKMRIERRAK